MKTNDIASALASKLKILFSKQDSFVAFTIPGIALTPNKLAFYLTDSTSGLTPTEALAAASDFARLVNLIPDIGEQWSSSGRVIWSTYELVLTQAVVASDNTTPAEGEELQRARDFLYKEEQITDLLGTRVAIVDTNNFAAYKLYRALYLQAQYEYNSMKLTADFSTDPTVVSNWAVIEPLKKASVDQAEQNWISSGFKVEVENAFATIEQITGRTPRITWEKWKDEFDQDRMTDLLGQDFYQTHFYPNDFYKSGSEASWMTLALDTTEIQSLNSSTTASSSIFPVGTGEDFTISGLSVELIRVSIVRPWLEPNLFRSRFWQWPDSRPRLSDAANPPTGDLPAYIDSAIFVRNVSVSFDPGLPENARIISSLNGGGSVGLGPFSFKLNDLATTSDSLKSSNFQLTAFICQKIPKSPNPDTALDWSGPNLAFPMHGEKEDQVATGRIKTNFTIDSNGDLNVSTRTWTNNSLVGFTGGVFVGLTDAFATIIWKTDRKTYGVDGTLIGRSDRTELWQATVPQSIFQRARGFVIIHEHAPSFRNFEWFESQEGKDFIRTVVQNF